MPTTLTNGIQLPDKGSVDWYNSMQSNYNLIDTHLGNTDVHVTAEDKANWDSKQGSLSQAQLDAIAQVATNTSDIATLQSGKANASHTHSSSDITDIGDYATKQYVDNSISGLVDNAPDALNTLNELSAALNDDSNFASTVTNALASKANSADLATVATSGSYTDLSNKPSIPTKTSDLTNDSNYVDTSNSAIASGITSTKVTAYDGHIADTDIHVTTADKQKWNNGVSQAYVVRYASVAVSDNSTVPYSNLNNTDNIKANDLLLDTNGKLYQISSVDTANETVSVTTPLTQLAVDSSVMHLSGNETVGGFKTFDRYIQCNGGYIGNEASTNARTELVLRSNRDTAGQSGIFLTKFRQNKAQGELSGNDVVYLTLDILENSVRTNGIFRFNFRDFVNDIPQDIGFYPTGSKNSLGGAAGGSSNNKWHLFNGINPGALSFPDLSAAVDISGYISVTNGQCIISTYTAPADGWIYVNLGRSSGSMGLVISNGIYSISGRDNTFPDTHRECPGILPVFKNDTITILSSLADSVLQAYFYPCLGNV